MLEEVWVQKRNEKLFCILLVITLLALASQNWMLGLLAAILDLGCLLFIKKRDMDQEKILMKYLDDLSAGVEAGTVYAVKNLPLGIAMINEKRHVVWSNGVFRSWTKSEGSDETEIDRILPGTHAARLWGKSGWFDCKLKDNAFRVVYKFLDKDGENGTPYLLFYLLDRTEMDRAVEECRAAMPVFCLIRVDNISEVTGDMTDSEKSNLLSEVNECILDEFSSLDGFIKQYAQADFVACLSRAALAELMERHFDILDKVRAIRTVNRIPVTLSIGIVQSEDEFARQAEEAQSALDLALGRGGDQAVVRIGRDMKVFGGKTQATGSMTRVRVRVVAHALKELVNDSDRVIIMGHLHEDYDALGAAAGLACLFRADGREAYIAVSSADETSRKMRKAIREDEELSDLLLSDSEAKDLVTDKTLVFAVDTHVPEMIAAPDTLARSSRRIIIDHHRRSSSIIPNTLLTYMEPSASSASELVTELIQYYDTDGELPQLAASCLYAGIVVDTKNFSVQTGIRTFDAASYLRRIGADTKLVKELFAVDIETTKIKSAIMAAMKIKEGCVAVAECPAGTAQAQIIAGQVADFLVNVEGIRASVVYYPMEKQRLGISARSDGSLNVQTVMEAVGGGGHMTVSGAQISEKDKEDAAKKILAAIREQLKEEEQ